MYINISQQICSLLLFTAVTSNLQNTLIEFQILTKINLFQVFFVADDQYLHIDQKQIYVSNR